MTVTIATGVIINAPREEVFRLASNFDRQAAWMENVLSFRRPEDEVLRVGSRLQVTTQLGPWKSSFPLEITDWQEGSLLKVVHRNGFWGEGVFSFSDYGLGKTLMLWNEKVRVSLTRGGPLAEAAAKVALTIIMRRDLANLKYLVENQRN